MRKLIFVLSSCLLILIYHLQSSEHVKPAREVIDQTALYQFIPKNGILAEIGVLVGDNSELMLQVCQPKQFYLIDCWQVQVKDIYKDYTQNQALYDKWYHMTVKRFSHEPRIQILKKFSREAAILFPDGFFDFIYIDANHSYEAVKDDVELWYQKVKPGGYLGGHDYNYIETPGVKKAVDEFIQTHNLQLECMALTTGGAKGTPPSWLIKKPW